MHGMQVPERRTRYCMALVYLLYHCTNRRVTLTQLGLSQLQLYVYIFSARQLHAQQFAGMYVSGNSGNSGNFLVTMLWENELGG